MKTLLAFLITLSLLTSCENEVPLSDLERKDEGYIYAGKLYTGIGYKSEYGLKLKKEYYENGKKIKVIEYFKNNGEREREYNLSSYKENSYDGFYEEYFQLNLNKKIIN